MALKISNSVIDQHRQDSGFAMFLKQYVGIVLKAVFKIIIKEHISIPDTLFFSPVNG